MMGCQYDNGHPLEILRRIHILTYIFGEFGMSVNVNIHSIFTNLKISVKKVGSPDFPRFNVLKSYSDLPASMEFATQTGGVLKKVPIEGLYFIKSAEQGGYAFIQGKYFLLIISEKLMFKKSFNF